jgi:hypothetical protein
LPEDQVARAMTELTVQLATLNANYMSLCSNLGDIKALLERQNGRVRELEIVHAKRDVQVADIEKSVAALQQESTGRNSLVWNTFNSLAAFIATYLAIRH